MKKNLVLVGTMVVLAIGGFVFGHESGYDNGYIDGLSEGIEEGHYAGRVDYRQSIEEELRSEADNGRLCSYYGIDGITVEYQVFEGNINDELRD